MDKTKTTCRGVLNIVRFNWPFFAVTGLIIVVALCVMPILGDSGRWIVGIGLAGVLLGVVVSLAVSFYVYDLSNLNAMPWLRVIDVPREGVVVNVNAGFDETTVSLRRIFPKSEIYVWDFYDAARHTESSIKRARRAYPPHPETRSIQTDELPMADGRAGLVCVTLAAHEIRCGVERQRFFREIRRILKGDGVVCVTEHVRDVSNFIAYTAGALHFLSKQVWLNSFRSAGFVVVEQRKHTPFISVFVLKKE
jgi:hypothetical protein